MLPRLAWSGVAVVVLAPALVLSEFDPSVLVEAGNLRTMGRFLAGFWPPEGSSAFLVLLAQACLETLAMATAGITLAVVLAVPTAFALSRSLTLRAQMAGRPAWLEGLLRGPLRALLLVLRGVPELVWALLLVRVFGLGPAAGVMALALTYGGMLGKVYAEILESADQRPARALLEAGGGRIEALAYGLLPACAPELVSYTVYRWECALRASVVMGFVGAGGLGQLMDQSMKMLNGGEAATILLVLFALVLLADTVSARLRALMT
ncbi:MAG: ABC transporter permease subunit [Rhodocyclaceae bacterium]|nr:ABC transporter permease subunit [Rhodocyclaceae bacterium]